MKGLGGTFMKGLGISPGVGIGKIYLYEPPRIKIEKNIITDIELEVKRLDEAIKKASLEIDNLIKLSLSKMGKDESEIFVAQKTILEDQEFYIKIIEKINNEMVNCEWALKEVSNHYISLFKEIKDEYLRERASDVKDVSNRVIKILLGVESKDLSIINKESIIIAKDLSPSDTAHLNKEMVLGIVTELGGFTSHTSIIARSFEIPAISGVKDITKTVDHGDTIIINGDDGEIIINPTQLEILKYSKIIKKQNEFKTKLKEIKKSKAITKDGYFVKVLGNISNPDDIDKVIEFGGGGVGLFRTEFLYMDKDRLPSEEEQFEVYKTAAKKLGKKPLIIRTLDIGGDKDLPYLNLPKETNPFLGYRAIRLCLDRKEIMITQLKAILRASKFGNIKILLPMISELKEVRESKALLRYAKSQLKEEKIDFYEDIKLGIMVEVPAVAIHSSAFAKEVDFFSIGTNDLIQYTLAVDRGNHNIAHLYSQYHPSVLKLIKMTIENAHREGIWVGMCGEAAGDEKLIPILLAMGLDEFSMNPSSISRAKYTIINTSKSEIQSFLEDLLKLSTTEDVICKLNQLSQSMMI